MEQTRRPAEPWIAGLARLYDQQLRDHVSSFSNMHGGRSRSAAYVDDLYFRLVALAEPQRFVEVGAYKAEASRRIRSEHPGIRAVAFEANPHNHARYSKEIDYAAAGVEYLHLAVADGPTELTFQLRTEAAGEALHEVTGNSSLLRRTDDDTTYEEIPVPATALDRFFPPQDAVPTCSWIDVEGASGAVLSGGEQFLKSCKVVKIEVEEKPMWRGQWLSLDVIEHFLAAGFQPMARDIEYENQFNIVFVENDFARDHRVLSAMEYQGNYMVHHLSEDIDDTPVTAQPDDAPAPVQDAPAESPARSAISRVRGAVRQRISGR